MEKRVFTTPLQEEDMRSLVVGDVIYITGHIFTARDMGHLKIKALLEAGEPLPKDFTGAAVFHAGPIAFQDDTGAWQLNVIGPTTSIRMEPYAEMMGELGVKAILGKGGLADGSLAAAAKYGYIYLQAAPGCAAQMSQGVDGIVDVQWFDEMGMPEALWDLEVTEFGPLVVGMDTHGASVYASIAEEAVKIIDDLYPA
jgi:fumarate hydratase subunit beta/L(+)-tartrate dehydratase beta subunit